MTDKDDDKNANDDYEIGYGRPPEHSRWKKGQSGNSRGRPKGSRSLDSFVSKLLLQPVVVRQGNQQRHVSSLEAVFLALMKKAHGGDVRAITELLGLARQSEEKFANEADELKNLSDEDASIIEAFRVREGDGDEE